METDSSILIVDDNTRNLKVLAEIIREKGWKVALAEDGKRALAIAEKRPPDLILMDVDMPGMDGYEVCSRLKSMEGLSSIPVIFISALTETDDKVRGFDAGGVDYITKPFNREEILARVRTHLYLKKTREELEQAYQKLKLAYEEIEIAAKTDSLTQLSNRRDIFEKLFNEKKAVENGCETFSIILADIDDFKAINDNYGHDCGDVVLQEVSRVIRSRLRQQDTAARWGGEEFLVLLTETRYKEAFRMAEQIHRALSEKTFSIREHHISVTMTMGVSEYHLSQSVDDCIRIADQTMYQGKQSGKNRVVRVEDRSCI